jgi:hypothetical protein
MWAEVSFSSPHLRHKGLLIIPIKLRCLCRVLCPVRRPIMTLDCVLLKDKSLVFALGLGPKISSQACLWVLPRSHHLVQCWLCNQHLIFLLILCLAIPKGGSAPTDFWTEPSLVSLSVVLFLSTSACPGAQCSPTVCWLEKGKSWTPCELKQKVNFQDFHCHTYPSFEKLGASPKYET